MFNRWQPVRPRIHPETGEVLMYATMPNFNRTKIFKVCDPRSMKSQCRLYRAVRQGFVDKQVAIGELYEFAFNNLYHEVSKTQMGYNAIGSVIYEPRLLVNSAKVGKATMTYTFRNILDFQYGLEWQICTWLWKFLNDSAAPGEAIGSSEEMAEELDMLANASEKEYVEVYEREFDAFWMEEPVWRKVCSGLKEELPSAPKKATPTLDPVPPRKLSRL